MSRQSFIDSPRFSLSGFDCVVECIGSATQNIGHSAELENRLELELNRVIRDADTPQDSTEDDEREHGVLLNSKRTDNWYSRAISALQNIPADLSLEDSQLLLDLRWRFEQMGKDTITFTEAVQIVIPYGGKHLIFGDKSNVRCVCPLKVYINLYEISRS